MKILDTLQYYYKKSEITTKEKICCFTGHRKIKKMSLIWFNQN